MAQPKAPVIDAILHIDTVDLYNDIIERQVDFVSPESFAPNATFVQDRRYIVDWMVHIGDMCRLHHSTIHVSILYLDKILRSRELPRHEWRFLAAICISLAAKYEEKEEHCPLVSDLLLCTKLYSDGYNCLLFREGEVKVMACLQYKLRAFPAIHVVGYYFSRGVSFGDDLWQFGRVQHSIHKIKKYTKKYSEFFCQLTMQNYSFQKHLPTHLAAAIIMATRVALKIEPKWRPELAKLTGYDECEIKDCFWHVWTYYATSYPNHVAFRAISPRTVMRGHSFS